MASPAVQRWLAVHSSASPRFSTARYGAAPRLGQIAAAAVAKISKTGAPRRMQRRSLVRDRGADQATALHFAAFPCFAIFKKAVASVRARPPLVRSPSARCGGLAPLIKLLRSFIRGRTEATAFLKIAKQGPLTAKCSAVAWSAKKGVFGGIWPGPGCGCTLTVFKKGHRRRRLFGGKGKFTSRPASKNEGF